MKILKWQEEYFKYLEQLSNENLLAEYEYLASGDDYDGGHTKKGRWEFEIVTAELYKRLYENGFLKTNI